VRATSPIGYRRFNIKPLIMHFKSILFSYIFLLLLIVPAIAGSAVNPERKVTINELTATTSENHLIVFGTLENSFNSEMIEILHSGIALRFSFFIELFKTTGKEPDELIATHNFQHTMTFDTQTTASKQPV
jgi:hypothetical protein